MTDLTSPGQGTAEPRPEGRRGSGGRPTRAAALERDERLLAIAAALFEERGYEGTSIDALADAAGVGKATVYARFQDKRSLFISVYRQRVAAVMLPLAEETAALSSRPASPERLAHTLEQVGMILIRRSLSPGAIRMNRVILAEALRFPELAELVFREGWSRIVSIVGSILRLHAEQGVLRVVDTDMAADLFLNMVIGRQQRVMMLGLSMHDEPGLKNRVRTAVAVFLNGVSAAGTVGAAGPGDTGPDTDP